MINALSIDLEFWYSGEPYSNYLPDVVEDQIEEPVIKLLDLLNKHDTLATFFVLGKVAEKYPSLIHKIYEYGHEISSHGYSHKRLYNLNEELFDKELKKSINLLKNITGEKPLGFRAPSFSIDNSTKWALKSLAKYGFKYDSSIFPIKTRLYGVPNAPLKPYRPSIRDITQIDENSDLIEFPLSVIDFIKRIPISGGYYFRILPLWFIDLAIKKINKKRPVIIYIHPWETYHKTPHLNIPFPKKIVAYYGIKKALKKIEKIIQKYNFRPVNEVLKI